MPGAMRVGNLLDRPPSHEAPMQTLLGGKPMQARDRDPRSDPTDFAAPIDDTGLAPTAAAGYSPGRSGRNTFRRDVRSKSCHFAV